MSEEEIKEILDKLLEYFKKSNINDFGYEKDKLISYEEAQIILDYITNLQEENERLNMIVTIQEDYKSRNEKAIEYINIIKNNTPSSTRKDDAKMILINYEDLLNILQGKEK